MRVIDDLAAEWESEWLESLKGDIHVLHLCKEVHDEFMELLDPEWPRELGFCRPVSPDVRGLTGDGHPPASRR